VDRARIFDAPAFTGIRVDVAVPPLGMMHQAPSRRAR
jgi:hypothetical protein